MPTLLHMYTHTSMYGSNVIAFLQDERVLDPMEMPILFTPLPHPLPLPKPPLSYLVSITGFAGTPSRS
jgi:hypothetical protein